MVALHSCITSPRAKETARRFGVEIPRLPQAGDPPAWPGLLAQPPSPTLDTLSRCLAPGEIALITGASGAGKSTLLRAAESCALCPAINLASIRLPERPVVDCFPALTLTRTLRLLGRFGLGEVWTYLRTPKQLSEGERFRLRLAMSWHAAHRLARTSGRGLLVADEFASCLDRITARIIARNLRRVTTRGSHLSCIIATAHDDLQEALQPDWLTRCDFGQWHLWRGRGRRE